MAGWCIQDCFKYILLPSKMQDNLISKFILRVKPKSQDLWKSTLCSKKHETYSSLPIELSIFRVESKSPKTPDNAPMGGTTENWYGSPSRHRYQDDYPWGKETCFFLPTSVCTGLYCIGTCKKKFRCCYKGFIFPKNTSVVLNFPHAV